MKKYFLFAAAAFLGMLGLAGCTKEPTENLSAEESRIYITNRDSTADFTSFATFSIADSLAIIDNNKLAGRDRTEADAGFIEALKNEMQARGYTLVDKSENPDLGINLSKIYNTYTGVVTNPHYYWGGYGGFYDPYYWGYGGYPYYFPPYYDFYQVTEGALSIDILDLKEAASSKEIKGIWQGLIRGSGIFNQPAAAQVKALFDQSPYLKKNQ